eukprot:8453423-Heterocapsa_arctica.AAC.1
MATSSRSWTPFAWAQRPQRLRCTTGVENLQDCRRNPEDGRGLREQSLGGGCTRPPRSTGASSKTPPH